VRARSGDGLVVAIDGPSGSGKSSVSRGVARRLGLAYLDTGAMYRAVTWWCLQRDIDLAQHGAVADAAQTIDLRLGTDPDGPTVHVGETDVAEAIRDRAISAVVSAVATNLEVRAELQRRQRELSAALEHPGVVAEGRDITTVVAPDAPARILLTASEEVRMARRSAELAGHSAAATGAQLRARDAADSKVVDFMNAADGVTTVDSTDLDFDATVEAVLGVIRDAQVRTG
jgi:cytidylate kinase